MNSTNTIVWAMCGSFCTFSKTMPCLEKLSASGRQILPLMSFNAAGLDTRFGTAKGWQDKLLAITGHAPILTLQAAEPLGPAQMADAMIIAPCTGATLAKLSHGISDTPVTLGAKSMLRAGKPVILALSTNDGLSASFENLARLLNRKHYYLVPFAQDDYLHKPSSLQSDFSLICDTLEAALHGRQLGPVLNP